METDGKREASSSGRTILSDTGTRQVPNCLTHHRLQVPIRRVQTWTDPLRLRAWQGTGGPRQGETFEGRSNGSIRDRIRDRPAPLVHGTVQVVSASDLEEEDDDDELRRVLSPNFQVVTCLVSSCFVDSNQIDSARLSAMGSSMHQRGVCGWRHASGALEVEVMMPWGRLGTWSLEGPERRQRRKGTSRRSTCQPDQQDQQGPKQPKQPRDC
ncbi:hypothetical protein B0T22DRAFT_453300 [Podospora appendiculata]|uniref:Uncharacterized protein n=1 Tax=Podospora appendiculata TaxID=314037 RepID=A0AAE1CHI1_9PEZI|nr:hypothetical protein B0T22DRAFT_453300 [Podospora appendiculata]